MQSVTLRVKNSHLPGLKYAFSSMGRFFLTIKILVLFKGLSLTGNIQLYTQILEPCHAWNLILLHKSQLPQIVTPLKTFLWFYLPIQNYKFEKLKKIFKHKFYALIFIKKITSEPTSWCWSIHSWCPNPNISNGCVVFSCWKLSTTRTL